MVEKLMKLPLEELFEIFDKNAQEAENSIPNLLISKDEADANTEINNK